jgi:predicted PurR-regulated permease PerM
VAAIRPVATVAGAGGCGHDDRAWTGQSKVLTRRFVADPISPAPESSAEPVAAARGAAVPGWLNRLAAIGWRVLVTLALLIVFANVAIFLSTVTGAIVVGLTVAAMVYPVVQRLQVRRGWPRARAAAAASLLAVIIVVLVLFVIIVAFIPSIAALIDANRAGVVALSARLVEIGAPPVVLGIVDNAVTGVQTWLVDGIAQLVGPIASFTTIMILGGFLTFYLLDDGDRAWVSVTGNLHQWQAESLTRRAALALDQVSGYLRGTAALAVVDALVAFALLAILGVPVAGPLAVLVFIGGFVPYVGSLATTTVLVLVTLGTGGVGKVIALLVALGLVSIVEQRTLIPRVYGSGLRVNPGLALIAIAIGGALLGPIGLFAAVPILAAVLAFTPALVEVLGTGPKAPSAPGIVPVWLDRVGQFSWRALVVLALLAVVTQAIVAPILSLPVILAAILACVLKPVERRLRRRGVGPTGAAFLATAASVAIVLLVVGVTVLSLVQSLPDIVQTTTVGAGSLDLGVTPVAVVRAVGNGLTGAVTSVIGNAAGVAIGIAIALVLTFYLLRDGADWWAALLRYVPTDRRGRVDQIGGTSVSVLYGSMVGTAIVSFAGAVMQWLTMTLLGLPLAFPLSVLMFFGGFIPYIGSAIVTLLGFLVAVAVGSTTDIVLMGIFTIVFNIVQGNIVAPLVYGRTVSIHPAVVLLAAPAGGAIAGIVGMVLIVPILAIISRTWRTVIHLFDQEPSEAAPSPTAEPAPASSYRAPAVDNPASAPAGGT